MFKHLLDFCSKNSFTSSVTSLRFACSTDGNARTQNTKEINKKKTLSLFKVDWRYFHYWEIRRKFDGKTTLRKWRGRARHGCWSRQWRSQKLISDWPSLWTSIFNFYFYCLCILRFNRFCFLLFLHFILVCWVFRESQSTTYTFSKPFRMEPFAENPSGKRTRTWVF